jgi:Cysteine-rich secretory protein family
VALALSFRISGPLGDAIAERFGGAPETVRVVVGLFVLVLVAVGALSLAHSFGDRRRRGRPDPVERVGGAGVAVVTGILVVAFAVSMIRVLPLGPSAEAMLESSAVTGRLVPRGGATEQAVTGLVGDEVVSSVLALEPLVGERRVLVTGDETVDLAPVDEDDLRQRPEMARDLEEMVNAGRLAAELEPLAWSEGLAGIAAAHAGEMYSLGLVSRSSPTTGGVADRVAASSIRLSELGEVVGLAATVSAFEAATSASPDATAVVHGAGYDRIGIGVVDGPYGVMVVEVLGR